MALDEQLRISLPREMKAALLRAAGETDADVSELVRACITIALPSLLATPGMIPLCQPGVLRTIPRKG